MKSETYTKLFSTIVTSTIWQEDKDTKILWITMLAIADFDGRVDGSIPGLANLAGLSIGETRKALDKLMAPDPYSRTKDNDGRRIAEIDGGWIILNYAKYRNKGNTRKEYYRSWRAEQRCATEKIVAQQENVLRNSCATGKLLRNKKTVAQQNQMNSDALYFEDTEFTQPIVDNELTETLSPCNQHDSSEIADCYFESNSNSAQEKTTTEKEKEKEKEEKEKKEKERSKEKERKEIEEKEKEKEREASVGQNLFFSNSSSADLNGHFPDALAEYWNSKPQLPKILKLTKKRITAIKMRQKEPFFVENWREAIDRIAASDFCCGKNDRGWRATIDWFISNDNNIAKIIEGRYDNTRASITGRPCDIGFAAQVSERTHYEFEV